MSKFEVGDIVNVIDGGKGAKGCNGCIACVTKQKAINGLNNRDFGINIEILNDNGCDSTFKYMIEGGMVGSIWRVREKGLETYHVDETDLYNVLDEVEFTRELEDMKRKDNKTIVVEVDGKVTTSTIIDYDGKKIGKCSKRPHDKYDEKIGIMLSVARALEFDDESMKMIMNAVHKTYMIEDWMLSTFTNEKLLNEIENRMIEDGE